MNKMETFIWGLVFGILSHAGGNQLYQSHLKRKAYECAVTSDMTDWGIESCYAKFNVPFPGYIHEEQ